MAVVFYVVKEGNYSATCLESDTKPLNPPDNCDLTVIDNGKLFKSLGGVWVPAVPIILQNNRWVDINGSDTVGLGDGSIINPFRTIQKAIDSITGSSASNPYIINIGLGTFEENITLKDGLSMVGLSKHFLDSEMNLTIISGNVTSNATISSVDCNFAGIEFKGSAQTISIVGSSSAITNTTHFSSCRILSTLSASNYSNIVFNDIFLDHPTTNVTFSNNSVATFYQGIMERGVDIDITSSLKLFGATTFSRSLSNILGPETHQSPIENFYYDNLASGLSATNPQAAIDELKNIVTTGVTNVQPGSNIATGGTPNAPIISVVASPSFNNANFSGTATGNILSATTLSANTINIINEVSPTIDNTVDLGSSVKRFRQLNIVNGVAVNFTASTEVYTSQLKLGSTAVYENNIILTGHTLDGGAW